MRAKQENKEQIRSKVQIETSAQITDFQYNHNGNKLAVSDSEGYIFIYERQNQSFNKTATFRGDQASIWKLAWADPIFGETIAIGTFKRKVAVFQLRNTQWTQIAYHQLHQGSVNHVQWASPAYGCKLFSAGSEGTVGILEIKKNSWTSSSFVAHQSSISGFSIRPLSLNQSDEQQTGYPMIATAAKDSSVKIWRHISQIPEKQILSQSKIYQQIFVFKPHKETVRSLLFKKRWFQNTPIQYQLFTCSQDGDVKLSYFVANKLKQSITICKQEAPVLRISQSLTGNILSVSVGEYQQSYLYGQRQSDSEWQLLQQLK